MPVEVQNLIPEVLHLPHLCLSSVILNLRIGAIVNSKPHILAVLNNWVTPSHQEKLDLFRIVNSNLMRTEVNLTILSSVDEASPTYTTYEDLAVGDVLNVEGLYQEG